MKVNQPENAKTSKGLLVLLAIAVLLTLWMMLQSDDAENTDVIELADASAPASLNRPMTLTNVLPDPADATDNALAIPIFKPNSLQREPLLTKPYNLFKVHSWVIVPPAKKVKPEPPPPPVAPPAPFTYLGKFDNAPKNVQIFLLANGKLYTTRAGEIIDQQWRLDAEEANALRLTYLPLNLPQVLSKSAKPISMTKSVDAPVAEVNL